MRAAPVLPAHDADTGQTPLWHDGPLDALAWDGSSPVAWSVAVVRARHPPAPDGARRGEGDGRGMRAGSARALVARLAGVAASDVQLARSPAGAPLVVAPAGWHLGLSGRDGHHLIAAARVPIAADREPFDAAPPLWDMLTVAEAAALRRLPAAGQPRAWLRRWTMKEAHAKLVGAPRRIAPEQVETAVDTPARGSARFEGRSRCWTREAAGAVETVAWWAER